MSEKSSCYLLFDERMTLHRPPKGVAERAKAHAEANNKNDGQSHPSTFEVSKRVVRLYQEMRNLEERLMKEGRSKPFQMLQASPCDRFTIELAHTPQHYNRVLQTSFMSDEALLNITDDDDLYYCRDTFLAASLAVGGVVNCVDAVMESWKTGEGPTRAVALVRPPGHHATADQAMGFCYFNNIAVAAKHAIHTRQADRVFILDWDIHHGNGIQDITYDDPNIFYLSIHRGSFGVSQQRDWFYPGTGRAQEVGHGLGEGTNLNIAWGRGGMGNTEYAAAFTEIVLPVLSSFNPDLIIVGCGFDAAKGDLLGDCGLSPDMYHTMTNSLLEMAGHNCPIVVALEGGYNLDTIAVCMEATALALLDEPLTRFSKQVEIPVKPENVLSWRDYVPEKVNLSHYWKHEDLYNIERSNVTTRKAISSLKKAATAFHKKGRYAEKLGFRPQTTAPVTYSNQIFPLCNRPCQKGLFQRRLYLRDFDRKFLEDDQDQEDDGSYEDDEAPYVYGVTSYSVPFVKGGSPHSPIKKRKVPTPHA